MKPLSGNIFWRCGALSAVLALTPLYQKSFAQDTASIQGAVTNRKSGAPLPDVDITLLNTHFGDVSDSTGTYQIRPLSAGKYSVRASRIGFETQVVTDFLVKNGETRTINFALVPKPIRLDEVTVELRVNTQLNIGLTTWASSTPVNLASKPWNLRVNL